MSTLNLPPGRFWREQEIAMFIVFAALVLWLAYGCGHPINEDKFRVYRPSEIVSCVDSLALAPDTVQLLTSVQVDNSRCPPIWRALLREEPAK